MTVLTLADELVKVGGAVIRPVAEPRPKLTVATMPALVVDAHRGGCGEAPENTFEAVALSVAGGVTLIDLDTTFTSDGRVIAHHDTTLNRTTNGSGSVETASAPQISLLRVDGGEGYAPGWGLLRVPFIEQILDRWADLTYFTLEAKNIASIPALAALIRDRDLTESVYINSNRVTDAPLVHAEDCLFHYWSSTTSAHVTAAADAGTDLINIAVDLGDDVFDTAFASSIPKVFATGVIRRNRMARVLDLGVDGWISDYPLYVGQSMDLPAPHTSIASRLAARKQGRGWIYDGAAPSITDDGKIRFAASGTGTLLLGDISSSTAPASYQLRYRHQWSTVPGDSGYWCGMRFGGPTDGVWTGGGGAEDGGYTVVARHSGVVDLYFEPEGGGTSTLIGTLNVGASLGSTAHTIAVDVTPTTITVTHEGSGATTGPVAHSTLRGGYVHIAKAGGSGVADVDLVELLA